MTEKKPYNPKKKAYNIKYEKEHMKRIPLNMLTEEYEKYHEHAISRGEPMNTFIKRSMRETMERDLQQDSSTPETAPEQPNNEE